MVIVLHPEQEAEVTLLSEQLNLPTSEVVRHLLSGPLSLHMGESLVTSQAVPA
jgi:hypothetical protein